MMAEVLALLLKWWAVFFAGILAVCLLAYLAIKLTGSLKKLFRRGCIGLAALTVVCVLHGGAKNIKNRFSADDGIAVVSAEMNIATNETDMTTLVVTWTGPNEGQPLYVREKVTDRWASIDDVEDGQWLFDERIYANGTNTATWFMNPGPAASNATMFAMWHLGGNDLPPVEIVDGDGISILSFGATSHQVVMSYGINPSALGDILNYAVIEMAAADGIWTEAWRATVMPINPQSFTNEVTFTGFYVGRTTRWRARLEVVTP